MDIFDSITLFVASATPLAYAIAVSASGRALTACIALSALMTAGAAWLCIHDEDQGKE